jgi:hypothetical protein
MPPKKAKKQEEEEGTAAQIIKVLIVLVAALFILAYIVPKQSKETTKYGVKVSSEIPLEQLREKQYIGLYNTTATPAELTCKFELSAISKPDIKGYKITIGEGDTGIYLKSKEAAIKGRDQDEILRACHVFACLRDGIECPNFLLLGDFIGNAKSMSVILDNNVDQVGGRGYAEIVGALSYMQTKRADINGDGVLNQSEVDANEFFIYPFIKEGDVCSPQPMNTLIQNWSKTNRTSSCRDISPAIMLTASNESAMRIVGEQLIVTGTGDSIHTSSIILRDFIAPEWIRRMYGFM